MFLNAGTTAQQEQTIEHWQTVVKDNPNDAKAWFNIGVLHETGQGVEKNQSKAHDAYKKSIQLGYAPAMYNLGSIYAKQNDYANARVWWEKAAELDLPEAQYNMGMLYEKGWGVSVDPQLSSSWYQRAAETAMEKYFQLYLKSRSEHSDKTIVGETSLSLFARLVFINTASAATSVSELTADPNLLTGSLQLAQVDNASNSNDQNTPAQGPSSGWNWIYSQPQENFTIQLFATKDADKTDKFIQQYALSERAQVIQAVVKGTTYHKVLLGSFNEWNDAAVEIGAFPQDLRNQRPWVRKFGSLYAELPQTISVSKNQEAESEPDLDVVNVDTSNPVEPQSTDQTLEKAAQDEASVQTQAKIEQAPKLAEPASEATDESTDETANKEAENQVAIADSDGEAATTHAQAKIQTTNENLPQQTEAKQSQTTQNHDEVQAQSTDLLLTDDVFTPYAKKQLASSGLSSQNKAQLKSGLEAIAAGDHESGFKDLTDLAQSGLPEAQYRIALLYSRGDGVEQDPVRAFELMKSASEQGHPYAQQSLANYYVNGIGVDANSSLAAYWQQTAADNVKKLENN